MRNDHLGNLNGLKRGDMEDLGAEKTKWACGICGFHNTDEKHACTLCETSRGIALASSINVPERTTTIDVVQLNALQHAAWTRTMWLRTVPSEAAPTSVWTLDAEFASSSTTTTTYYTYTLVTPSESPTGPESESDDTNLPTPAALELVCLTPDATPATTTVTGETIPAWYAAQAAQLRSLPFSLKYAWMLEQMAASYDSRSGFTVARDHVLEQSLAFLMQLPPTELCSTTRVTMAGEDALDAGGVQREWYTVLAHAILDESAKLFVATNTTDVYMLHPGATSPNALAKIEAVGRLLGKAIIDGQVLPMRLCVPLFKALLGAPVSVRDVSYMDETTYKSLQFVDATETVEALALDFSVLVPTIDGGHEVLDLIPNGRAIDVTSANKQAYVDAMVRHLVCGRWSQQIGRLVRGFYTVLPPELISVFDYKELELVLCGTAEIDVSDWRAHTIVSRSLQCTNALEWFWDVLEFDMRPEDHAKFLHFTTGSSRVPLQGFKGLTSYDGKLCLFTLHATTYSRGCLPKVHTCFNRIDLPLYPSRGLMKDALFTLLRLESMAFTLE
ncbi:hypothetical protein SPRG_09689 [Saprolegnia parasitica CBS 223.65]|uniref:HECT-type E3 ubiquitin transferase n=1 Tax=Saprolegnia parasitica (strain CBS 223.65) TaxID=695850 RepID=A0A067CDG0_SAPPC|nr:hypothetical protein SPRG_09689 [Saprolegnia parasitica CBS 223.65]KDO24857.1 hypothetical protein SPRG_09689 [Saprolegnia parasitica CBS 223.65]|eukprot:XP_012204503.1 hypothetical protein SPRG_09689 [Saprolegnia parasitica CBS 223.65]